MFGIHPHLPHVIEHVIHAPQHGPTVIRLHRVTVATPVLPVPANAETVWLAPRHYPRLRDGFLTDAAMGREMYRL